MNPSEPTAGALREHDPPDTSLVIDRVETLVVGAGIRNWVFVRVTTAGGLVGWGEATTERLTRAVVGAVDDLRPLVIGKDARRIADLWQTMTRQLYWIGGIVAVSALSAIDQAVHDLVAQARGVPLHDLLGGRVRERIRCYDHLGGGSADAVYGEISAERFAEKAAASCAEGFDAVKILAVPVSEDLADSAALRATDRVMAAVREAVGNDVEIMVDMHGRCTPAAAVSFAEVLAPYRPWFIEEPCAPRFVDGFRYIAERVTVPLAAGERLTSAAEFDDLLRTRAVAVIQPDICHAGGYSGLTRIAHLAEVRGVSVAPHNPLGPIATAHNLHFAAATPNWLIQEQMRSAVPWFQDVLTDELVIRDGQASVPTGPGLGLAVNVQEALRHPPSDEGHHDARLPDGTVADW